MSVEDGVNVKITADSGAVAPALDRAAASVEAGAKRMRQVSDGLVESNEQVVKSAKDTSAKVDAEMGKLGASIGRLSGLFAGTVVVGFATSIGSAVRGMADLDDMAEKTGISVEQLSATMNTLAPAGHTVDQVTGAMTKLTRSMQGAGEDSSGAARAFKVLGVETRDASGTLRSSGEVFREVAVALNRYEDGTAKTALAMAVFGRSGAELLPMLKDLATMQERAATVTSEQAGEAEKLGKMIGLLRQQTVELAQSIGSTLVPKIINMIQQFQVGREAAGGLLQAMAKFGLSFDEPTKKIDTLMGRLGELQAQIVKDRVILDAPAGTVFGGGARSGARARIDAANREIDDIGKKLQYWRLLAEQQGKGTNLRSPGLYDADGVKPPAPGLPGKPDKAGKKGRDIEKEQADAIAAMQREIATYGQVGDAAKVAWEIENGRYRDFSKNAQQQLLLLAQSKDQAAAAEAVRKADAAAEEADIRAMASLTKSAQDAIRRQNEELERTAQKWIEAADPLEQYARKLSEVLKLEQSGDLTPEQARGAEFSIKSKEPFKDKDGFKWAGSMQAAFDKLFTSIRQGTVTMKGVVTGAMDFVANAVEASLAKVAADWITNMLVGKASSISTALSDIQASAARAGAAAFASTAAIPIVGPELAPAAAAASYAGAMSFASGLTVASAARGYDVPAGLNPMVQIHEKEMVLPAKQADVIRNMADGGGSRGNLPPIIIQSPDKTGVRRMLLDNPDALAAALRALQKQGVR